MPWRVRAPKMPYNIAVRRAPIQLSLPKLSLRLMTGARRLRSAKLCRYRHSKAERFLRGPAIGRRLSFGSDSETGAEFTALMYSVIGTLTLNGIDVLRWLTAWLTACAQNGGRPPDDLLPWLPWSMSGERRRELMAPG